MQINDLLALLQKYSDKNNINLPFIRLFSDGSGRLVANEDDIFLFCFDKIEELIGFLEKETSDYKKIVSLLKNSEYITLEMDRRLYVVAECKFEGDSIRIMSKTFDGGLCSFTDKAIMNAKITEDGICAKTTHETPCVLRTYNKKPTPNWI